MRIAMVLGIFAVGFTINAVAAQTSPPPAGPTPGGGEFHPKVVECMDGHGGWLDVGCACSSPILKLSCNEAHQCVRRDDMPIRQCGTAK
jgi:hypothetical protein